MRPVLRPLASLAIAVVLPWSAIFAQTADDPGAAVAAGAAAEPATTAAAAPPSTPAPTPAPPSADASPRVVAVAVDHKGKLETVDRLTLEDILAVEVSGLARWLERSKATCWDVRLVFDGHVVGGLGPDRCDLAEGNVWFNLERLDRANEPAWKSLLDRREGLEAPVEISVVAGADGEMLPSAVSGRNVPRMLLAHTPRLVVVSILFGVVLIVFGYLSVRSDMLRDSSRRPAAPARKPYSLSRFQMGWWFVLALGAFLLISLLTGDAVPIPGTVLGLMGIAAGTHVGSQMIDSSRSKGNGGGGTPQGGKSGAGTATPSTAAPGSQGFLRDIISDDNGVALHRFQNFIFTLALGGFFIFKVIDNLQMPEFDSSLLGLMGISAGTYLGVKVPEGGKGEDN